MHMIFQDIIKSTNIMIIEAVMDWRHRGHLSIKAITDIAVTKNITDIADIIITIFTYSSYSTEFETDPELSVKWDPEQKVPNLKHYR
jgi:hypothetical protein